MAITHYIPAGTTKAQTFQTLLDEAVQDLSGESLSLRVRDRNNRPITITGTVAFSDATTGTWTYTPDGQLTAKDSPYKVRIVMTLGGIDTSPNDKDPDTWIVVDP